MLALPTVRNIAPLVEEELTDPTAAIEANLRRNWMLLPMAYNTKPTNYTGHPALAVPCGKVDGMPISLQLVGNFLADPLLLRVAKLAIRRLRCLAARWTACRSACSSSATSWPIRCSCGRLRVPEGGRLGSDHWRRLTKPAGAAASVAQRKRRLVSCGLSRPLVSPTLTLTIQTHAPTRAVPSGHRPCPQLRPARR